MTFEFRGMFIPTDMTDSIDRYVKGKIPPGGFLSAVIANDLLAAVQRADDTNLRVIPAYVAYLHNHAPANRWGSEENFKSWLQS